MKRKGADVNVRVQESLDSNFNTFVRRSVGRSQQNPAHLKLINIKLIDNQLINYIIK